MERIKNLLKSKSYQELKEENQNKLIEKGYIFTKTFGWITEDEAYWLNEKLEDVNFGKTVETLDGIPCFDEPVTTEVRGKTFVKKEVRIYPFINEYYRRKQYGIPFKDYTVSWDQVEMMVN